MFKILKNLSKNPLPSSSENILIHNVFRKSIAITKFRNQDLKLNAFLDARAYSKRAELNRGRNKANCVPSAPAKILQKQYLHKYFEGTVGYILLKI